MNEARIKNPGNPEKKEEKIASFASRLLASKHYPCHNFPKHIPHLFSRFLWRQTLSSLDLNPHCTGSPCRTACKTPPWDHRQIRRCSSSVYNLSTPRRARLLHTGSFSKRNSRTRMLCLPERSKLVCLRSTLHSSSDSQFSRWPSLPATHES